MERDNYPALRDRSDLVYLDASNAFPLHERIITRATEMMSGHIGMPGKAGYADALVVTRYIEEARKKVAAFINADAQDIYFVSSASEAARLMAEMWCTDDTIVAYSPEDHISTLRAVQHVPPDQTRKMYYNEQGELHGNMADATVFFVTHVHPIYGTDIVPADFKKNNGDVRLIVDASQSTSRTYIDVRRQQADALYFSGHKCGALPGAGVLYIAPQHRQSFTARLSTASLPWQAISSIGTALDILSEQSMITRRLYLTRLTNYCIERLETLPGVEFSKGIAQALDICTGIGIVSFRLPDLSSYDLMLLLDDHHIAVRGGDHCVAPDTGNRDWLRVSMQAYTTHEDVDRLVDVLRNMTE